MTEETGGGAAGARGVVTAAVLIIGNEILSGRTQDENIGYLAKGASVFGP